VKTPRPATGYRADAEIGISKGVWLSESDRGLCRVSVHADAIRADLVLPAAVPIAALIPAIVDILAAADGRRAVASADLVATNYQLSRLGAPSLDASTTLAQNGVRDGTILVLTPSATELPAPSFDDAAEAVSATLDAVTRPWTRRGVRLTSAVAASWLATISGVVLIRNSLATNDARDIAATVGLAATASCVALLAAALAHRAFRDPITALTFGLLAVGFSAAAGFIAVPGGPGAPNVLLAAMATAVTSVVTIRVTGCGAVALTAVSCFAVVIAITALAGVITGAPLPAISSISALVSLGLLEASARVSIVLAGLSPRLPSTLDVAVDGPTLAPDYLAARAICADDRLTSLVAAFSSSAAVDAIIVGVHNTGTPRAGSVVFATVIGVALLLHAPSQINLSRTVALVGGAVATISTTLVVAAAASPQHALWIGAVALILAGATLSQGFITPTITFSPVARRSVELVEYLLLAALVPLACWICGLYSAVRGLNLI
jgi:type VII secretion integral membrane protein EccD